MVAGRINNSTLRHNKTQRSKARIGNDSGTVPGYNNGGKNPQSGIKKIYEYNRIRKTKPRSTR